MGTLYTYNIKYTDILNANILNYYYAEELYI